MKKKTLFSKTLNPVAKQFILATALLITSVVSVLVACRKVIRVKNRIHVLSFPISFKQEGCPYPPGCDARLKQIASYQYHALDTFADFTVRGNEMIIATKNEILYSNIQSFLFTDNRLIPLTK